MGLEYDCPKLFASTASTTPLMGEYTLKEFFFCVRLVLFFCFKQSLVLMFGAQQLYFGTNFLIPKVVFLFYRTSFLAKAIFVDQFGQFPW
jgi:hypothetical protein